MKSHDRNQSSENFSRLCLRSKRNASSSHDSTKKSEKTSKYFASPTKSEENAAIGMDITTTSDDKYNEQNYEKSLHTTSIESPYKNLTEMNSVDINTTVNEEKDFKTPKRVFKKKLDKLKLSSNPSNNVRKRGRKPKAPKNSKTHEQMVLTKTFKEHLSQTDVNPEHLQLAMALSRSLQDNHKRESEENKDRASSTSTLYPSTQQKIATLKQNLEQFGLKSNTNRNDVQHQRIPVKRKKKKSIYQYITPVLLLRTEEDRKQLISEKVTLVLSQNLQENVTYSNYKSEQHKEPVSRKLEKHWSDDHKIFKLNNFELDSLKNNDIFYVKSLNIPPTKYKCGSLLKDWTKIPGREKSPLRKCMNEEVAISNEDNNLPNSVSDQCTIKQNIIIHSSTENSDIMNRVTGNDTFKNNLQIRSFSNRSISPELFESDEEMVVEIPEKPLQEILICLDEEHSSQSLLNLTPRKNKSTVHTSVHLSPNKDAGSGENLYSKSVLSITPTKRNKSLNIGLLEKRNLQIDAVTSPLLMNKSSKHLSRGISNNATYAKNKSISSDLSDDDLFVNDNGICTFECFSNDNIMCFDLSHSSDEDDNAISAEKDTDVLLHLTQLSNKIPSLKDVSFNNTHTNVNQTLQNVSPIISASIQSSSSSSDISQILHKSMHYPEENVNVFNDKDIPETTRRSKSLNITEYISNMLNEEEISVISNSEQDELEKDQKPKADNIFDLTQSSTDSSSSNHLASDQNNCNITTKTSKGKVSGSDVDNTLSPVKSDKNNSTSKFEKHDSFKSTASDDINLTQGSQESIYISDEELNYSSVYGTPYSKKKQNFIYEDNYFYELSDDSNHEDNINFNSTPKTRKEALSNKPDLKNTNILDNCEMVADSPLQFPTHIGAVTNRSFDYNQLILRHPRIKNISSDNIGMKSRKSLFDEANLLDDSFDVVLDEVQKSEAGPSNTSKQAKSENQNSKPDDNNTTPKGEMVIKTTNVTPTTNYNKLDTPKITKELEKFGLKPLKRQRGIQILKHIYESTHPVVGQATQNCEKPESDDEDHRVIKRRKSNSKMKSTEKSQSPKKRKSPECYNEEENTETEPRMENVNIMFRSSEEKIEVVGDLMGENETADDLIFERKHSTKVASCRVPLHIAWHNLVFSQPELRKNILLYEPLQLDVLYKLLKDQGYKYHIQDLLTFLDRKCITIRTNQHQHRKSRQRKKSVSPQKCKKH